MLKSFNEQNSLHCSETLGIKRNLRMISCSNRAGKSIQEVRNSRRYDCTDNKFDEGLGVRWKLVEQRGLLCVVA